MNKRVRLIVVGAWALLLGLLMQGPAAAAQELPVGYISWDITSPGVGQFDIVNQTGPNSFFDSTWPVFTPVPLTDLSLSVSFSEARPRPSAAPTSRSPPTACPSRVAASTMRRPSASC